MTATLSTPAGEVTPPDAPSGWRLRLLPLAGRGGWLATLAVGLFAGLLRFVRLDIPFNGGKHGKVFDELYYVCDARSLLRAGVELQTVGQGNCDPTGAGGSYVVHPPLGKWLIAVGIKLFGEDPFGWRFASAVVGTLTVVLVVRAGRRMTGSTLLGCLAGLVLSLDGLHFVQSRIATLDIFLAFWVTAAFAALLADRDMMRRRLARTAAQDLDGWGPRSGPRPWRLVTGLCLGAALATKWSGIYYLVLMLVLATLWEIGARRSAGLRAPARATAVRSIVPLLFGLVVVPIAVYVLSWSGWFLSDLGHYRNWAQETGGYAHEDGTLAGLLRHLPDAAQSWIYYHQQILEFHNGLSTPHPYQSHAIGWLVLARPISYYYPPGITEGQYGCHATNCAREVIAIGNPVIWWCTIPVLIALIWLWASKRDWRAGALVALVLTGIVPWFRDDLHHRTMFLFYALPAVPFMALAAALVAGWALGGPDASPERRRWGAAGVGLYLALVVGVFAYFYPVLAAQTLDYQDWQDRMWFSSWT
ncbi:MAG: phospholipid carrier-dependent glycosyltransferase [Frankiales bacterium]|nr:phospholipid carrier-dependent glycosyltransferase [Frankiales bacterium]